MPATVGLIPRLATPFLFPNFTAYTPVSAGLAEIILAVVAVRQAVEERTALSACVGTQRSRDGFGNGAAGTEPGGPQAVVAHAGFHGSFELIGWFARGENDGASQRITAVKCSLRALENLDLL